MGVMELRGCMWRVCSIWRPCCVSGRAENARRADDWRHGRDDLQRFPACFLRSRCPWACSSSREGRHDRYSGTHGRGFVHAIAPVNLLAMLLSTIVGITIAACPACPRPWAWRCCCPSLRYGPGNGADCAWRHLLRCNFRRFHQRHSHSYAGHARVGGNGHRGLSADPARKAAKALFTACFASFCGGLLSCISLYFFSPLLAQLAMKFKSPEYFWLSLFGLTIIAGVSSKSIIKGLISGVLGLLISTIGWTPWKACRASCSGRAPCTTRQPPPAR